MSTDGETQDVAQQAPAKEAAYCPPPQKSFSPQKEAEAFLRSETDLDNVTHGIRVYDNPNGEQQITLHAETLKYMIDKGLIVKTDDGGKNYVIPGVGDGRMGNVTIVDENNKKLGNLSNEGAHEWTPDYVRQHILRTDKEIADSTTATKDYQPTDPEMKHRYEQILAHAAQTLPHGGANDTRIVITKDKTQDITSELSKDGQHNYIRIPQSELVYALSSDDGMSRMEAAIDAQADEIKKGNNSVDAYVRNHDIERLQGSGIRPEDDKVYLPRDVIALHDDAKEQMIKNHQYVECDKNTLDPQVVADIEKAYGKDGVKALPKDMHYYVVPGTNSDFSGPAEWHLMYTKKGEAYMVIDERAHVPDEAYVKQNRMSSDAELARDTIVVNAESYKPDPEHAADYNALIERANKNAGRDHVAPPTILISHASDAADIGSIQSREGHDYIIVSEAEMRRALAKPEEMKKLQHALDEEQNYIKHGDNSPAGLLRADKAARFIAENSPVEAGTTTPREHLPPADAKLDDDTVRALVRSGQFAKCDRDDIEPGALKVLADSGLPPDTPVYVMSGANSDHRDTTQPQIMYNSDGKPYMLIDETQHRWSAEYVRNNDGRETNASMQDAIDKRNLNPAENEIATLKRGDCNVAEAEAMQRRYQMVMDAVSQNAKDNPPINPPPIVLIDKQGRHSGGYNNAAASSTKEGGNYICVDSDLFDAAMKDDEKARQLVGIMAHECGHIRDGDTKDPDRIAKSHNLIVNRQDELMADLVGGGPLSDGKSGVHAASKLADSFEDDLRDMYYRQNPDSKIDRKDLTPEMLEAVSKKDVADTPNSDHPAYWDRIVALRYEAQMMEKYEAEHKKPGVFSTKGMKDAYAQAESDTVIKQTLDFMRTNNLYEYQMNDTVPVEPKKDTPGIAENAPLRPGNFTPAQHAAIHSAQKAMGQHNIADATTPTSAPHTQTVPSQDTGVSVHA